jgi:hypothetical protein
LLPGRAQLIPLERIDRVRIDRWPNGIVDRAWLTIDGTETWVLPKWVGERLRREMRERWEQGSS